MIELNVQQGSEDWLKARAKCFTASEASAMMGVSSYMKRSELIKQKATGIVPEVDSETQARFDAGHAAEAAARPLAEVIIGAELYPLVATDDSGKYLASSDGVASTDGAITFLPIGFEHKLHNESLASKISSGDVPESHKWQLVHQTLVFGFERVLFVVSDGTPDRFAHCWFSATDDDIKRLIAGWDQFEKDIAAYVPEEVKQKAEGVSPDALPALRIEVTGMVTASNLDAFKTSALAVFRGINTSLQTDQDFADAEKAVKFCKDAEDKLEAAKSHALSQTESIDTLFKTIDAIKEEARSVRLKLDKLVKAEKENRKGEIVTKARAELVGHVEGLHKRIGFSCIPVDGGIFAAAISGLKSLDSMRDKVSVALANAKVEANAIADRIHANHATVEDMSLFPDFPQVCTKAPDDFAALMAMRIGQRQARLDAERERIRAEEQAKAQREAEAKARAEAQEAAAKAELDRLAMQPKPVDVADVRQAPANDHIEQPLAMVEQPADTGKTMKLGEICAALGFTMTADFLASLGIHPVRTEKAARLYDANKFSTICRLISEHVMRLAFKKAA